MEIYYASLRKLIQILKGKYHYFHFTDVGIEDQGHWVTFTQGVTSHAQPSTHLPGGEG